MNHMLTGRQYGYANAAISATQTSQNLWPSMMLVNLQSEYCKYGIRIFSRILNLTLSPFQQYSKPMIMYANFHCSVDGICEGIPAGTVTLNLYAGTCRGHTSAGEVYYGWRSSTHLMIAETFVNRQVIKF